MLGKVSTIHDTAPEDEARSAERAFFSLEHLRSVGKGVIDCLATAGNQAIHGFGSERFWDQMRSPIPVETSYDTEHMVRLLYRDSEEPLEEREHVLIVNPLGTSSAGGYMAELANTFYRANFVVWNVSPPGFEGKLPLRQVGRLDVHNETKIVDEAIDEAARILGIQRPAFNVFGGSQGGGIAIGMHYRNLEYERAGGKIVAITPSSGHNSTKLGRMARYSRQFLLEEPGALAKHLWEHPDGPIRRGMQLLPTVNVKPGALLQVFGAGFGLIMRPGHEQFLSMAETQFDPEKIAVVCFSDDVVARANKWPRAVTQELKGLHMFVVDQQHAAFALDFFRQNPQDPSDKPAA